MEGGAHTRRNTQKAVSGLAGVMLFEGPQARRYTTKAVHTQGRTHKRWSFATAGVVLLKGPQARQYTTKAVHTPPYTHAPPPPPTTRILITRHLWWP